PRRRAEVDDPHPRPQDALLLLDLLELEDGARAPPLPGGPLDVGVALLAAFPAATGPAAPTHLCSSNGAGEDGAHNKNQDASHRRAIQLSTNPRSYPDTGHRTRRGRRHRVVAQGARQGLDRSRAREGAGPLRRSATPGPDFRRARADGGRLPRQGLRPRGAALSAGQSGVDPPPAELDSAARRLRPSDVLDASDLVAASSARRRNLGGIALFLPDQRAG